MGQSAPSTSVTAARRTILRTGACRQAVPRVTPYPSRFVQNYTIKPTHMFILYEGTIHTYRQIFMDGRKHPAELDPTWLGHSIGSWEKDTLVIDTVGYNDKSWFDHTGRRIRSSSTRPSGGRGSTRATWSTRSPSTTRRVLEALHGHIQRELAPPGDELMEGFCQENNQFGSAGGHEKPILEKP